MPARPEHGKWLTPELIDKAREVIEGTPGVGVPRLSRLMGITRHRAGVLFKELEGTAVDPGEQHPVTLRARISEL
jgi:hypothetical protein